MASDEKLRLPYRIQRQLELSSPQELHVIRNRRDKEVIRHLGLLIDFDHEWEALPKDVRDLIVKRVCSDTHEIGPAHLEWIKSRCPKDMHYEVYLARRDLNACLTLLVNDAVEILLHNPAQKDVPVRRECSHNFMDGFEAEVMPKRSRFRFIRHILHRLFRIFQNTIKFTVMAMIAEPEFQRELTSLLSRNPLKKPVVLVLSRFWLYSRFIQDMIYPVFLVRPTDMLSNSSFMVGATFKSSRK